MQYELHPIQQVFWDNHGLQCGYCTPGMILAAIKLLEAPLVLTATLNVKSRAMGER
jgi:aerobic-type carbon monoxide dehydrogenase small subunit (CoxS/CutS family)